MNKAFIEGKIYYVLTFKDFMCITTAALVNNDLAVYYNDLDVILPIRSMQYNDKVVGLYCCNDCTWLARFPSTSEEFQEYSGMEHLAWVHGEPGSIKDLIAGNERIKNDEIAYYMSVSGEGFHPNIDESKDEPLMYALKKAIIKKNCDIDKYASRFGSDFNNDRRKFKGHSITLKKACSISNNLDMAMKLQIYDKNPNVPNPIGEVIEIQLVPEEEEGEV